MAGDDFDLSGFQNDLDETLARGRQAFDGRYKDELDELGALSRDELESIEPNMTDLRVYDALMTVVKEASRVNLAQAELKQQIVRLGTAAVKIATHVPSLAELFG